MIKVLTFYLAIISFVSSETLLLSSKSHSHLRFTVVNPFDYSIQIRSTGTPFGSCQEGIRVFWNETELIRNSLECSSEDKDEVLSLEPREVKSVSFNIEKNYNLSTDSRLYTVWWEPNNTLKESLQNLPFLLDLAHELEGNGHFIAEKRNLMTPSFANISLLFTLSQSNNMTLRTQNQLVGLPKEDVYLDKVRDGLKEPLLKLIRKALDYTSQPLIDQILFRKWFDISAYWDHRTSDIVRQKFQRMAELLSTNQVSFNIDSTSGYCLTGTELTFWKIEKPFEIQLCYPRFFNEDLPKMGLDFSPIDEGPEAQKRSSSQVISALHELAHVAGVHAGEYGEVYDRNSVLLLPKTNPEQAMKNAQNYAYFVNSLPVTLKLISAKGWGIEVRKDNFVQQSESSETLSLQCTGEFPSCDGLWDPKTRKYLSIKSPGFLSPVKYDWVIMDDKPRPWTFEYKANGAYTMYYEWRKKRIGIIDSGTVMQVKGSEYYSEDFTSMWLVHLDDVVPNTRVITIKEVKDGLPYTITGKQVKCNQTKSTEVLKAAIIGPAKKCILKVQGVFNRFMARNAWTASVLIETDPDWWRFESPPEETKDVNKLWIRSQILGFESFPIYCVREELEVSTTDSWYNTGMRSVTTIQVASF